MFSLEPSVVLVALLFVCALGSGLVMVVRSVRVPGDLRHGPVCGACGHGVGAGQSRCGECGADLFKAGVLTPRQAVRWRGSGGLLALGWALLLSALGVPALMAASRIMASAQAQSMAQMYTFSHRLIPSEFYNGSAREGTPRAKPYELLITLDGEEDSYSRVIGGTLDMVFEVEGKQTARMHVDIAADRFDFQTTDGLTKLDGVGFTDELAARVFTAAGIGVTDEADRLASEDFSTFMQSKARWEPVNLNGFERGQRYHRKLITRQGAQIPRPPAGGVLAKLSSNERAGLLVASGLGIVYVIGLVVLTRMRSRLLGRATSG